MTQNYPNDNQPQYGQQYGQEQYGQSQYSQSPYGQAYGDGSATGYEGYEAEKPKRKWIGVTSLILAVAATVVGIILSVWAGVVWGEIIASVPNPENITPNDISEEQAILGSLVIPLLYGIPSLLGIGAIVFGIIAIVKKSARGLGIFGLILAIVAPVLAFVTWLIVVAVTGG